MPLTLDEAEKLPVLRKCALNPRTVAADVRRRIVPGSAGVPPASF